MRKATLARWRARSDLNCPAMKLVLPSRAPDLDAEHLRYGRICGALVGMTLWPLCWGLHAAIWSAVGLSWSGQRTELPWNLMSQIGVLAMVSAPPAGCLMGLIAAAYGLGRFALMRAFSALLALLLIVPTPFVLERNTGFSPGDLARSPVSASQMFAASAFSFPLIVGALFLWLALLHRGPDQTDLGHDL